MISHVRNEGVMTPEMLSVERAPGDTMLERALPGLRYLQPFVGRRLTLVVTGYGDDDHRGTGDEGDPA